LILEIRIIFPPSQFESGGWGIQMDTLDAFQVQDIEKVGGNLDE